MSVDVRALRAEAADHAAVVLSDNWDEQFYPVDPFEIARRLGITVYRGDLPEDVSGMLRAVDGKVSMYIDTDDHPRRQRFTAAHELGHFVRRRAAGHLDQGAVFVDRRGELAGLGTDPEEIYANEFAACLLMPAPIVSLLRRRGLDQWEMARFFDVSPASMGFRLTNLQVALQSA